MERDGVDTEPNNDGTEGGWTHGPKQERESNDGRRTAWWTWTKAGMDGSSGGGIYAPGLDSYSQRLLKGRLMTKEP